MTGRIILMSLLAAAVLCRTGAGAEASLEETRRAALEQGRLGNYANAGALFGKLVLDPGNPDRDAVADLGHAVKNWTSARQPEKIEPLLDEVANARPDSWRIKMAVAYHLIALPPQVIPLDGAMVRTFAWNRGARNAFERDRVAAINLMLAAEPLLASPGDPASVSEYRGFYDLFASLVASGRLHGAAWRFTSLTDLSALPDYESIDAAYGRGDRAAPVGADGNPVFYPLPESWAEAKNDGQRWRWLLGRLAEKGGDRDGADRRFADFLLSQFGVQTLGQGFSPLRDGDEEAGTGAFAVRTLADHETIARLATGIRRFVLPDEFNHIAMYKRLTLSPASRDQAFEALGGIFENRQQYPKALAAWSSSRADDNSRRRAAIDRIAGKNGMLEAGPVTPAGTRPRIPYLFRNGTKVRIVVQRLDEELLLDDIRNAIRDGKSGDGFTDSPEQIGRLVVERERTKYVVETTAAWETALEPLPDHRSKREYLEMPFDRAGAYLVTAAMADGNTSRVVLWVADTALVRKNIGEGRMLYYVADAATGQPVKRAAVSFFGYRSIHGRGGAAARPRFDIASFAEKTDENGMIVVDGARLRNLSWLVVATADDGRLAYMGFESIWAERRTDRLSAGRSAFIITDRPVYRPDQAVRFKVWLGNPSYGDTPPPSLANALVKVRIENPLGETVYDKILASDEFAGADDEIVLDETAPLGMYRILARRTLAVRNADGEMAHVDDGAAGDVAFRLEEYKKPEFEVTVETPERAIRLGDTAQVKVKAKYYFGAPVTEATVKYRILRTPFENRWYPPWRWDWLYGAGSSWQSYDYAWYPGWSEWGVARPAPPWLPMRFPVQPELVAEGEGVLDGDGAFRLPLDTMPARELFGNQDHRYDITVEVTDRSRRVIVGTGAVVASRKPFAVTVWSDRGYYLAGQDMLVKVKAATPTGGGVEGAGTAILYRVTYDDKGVPSESEAARREFATDTSGDASLRMKAGAAGQYRLACIVKDASGNSAEGAQLLTVRGGKGDGDYRFASLELVPDRREYAPGDTVRLAVNSERRDAVVLLFPRAERADGATPTPLRLTNGSDLAELVVGAADRPNFFFEALTVFDGRVYSEVREIFVPPADKTLSVEVKPNKDAYLPGEKAEFSLRVTDADGKPAVGQCVVTIYDKAVEYISGGSNVGDIRANFWKGRRVHHPEQRSSLHRHGYRVWKRGDVNWEPLGIFGAREADWNDDGVYVNGRLDASAGPGYAMAMPRQARMMLAESNIEAAADMEAPMALAAPPPPAPASGGVEGATKEQDMATPAVRGEFADTALWIAALDTDENGEARFSLAMPENLTAWKTRVWTMAKGVRVGEGGALVETAKNVIIRPQAPRFLTQKDKAVLSANLHNYLPRAKKARAELLIEGGLLELADGVAASIEVELAAGGEQRVDWLVEAKRPGQARIVMKLLTDEESDAAEIRLPVIIHGARRVEPFGGVMRSGENEIVIPFRVPEERLAEQSRLELTFSPSIASAMLEALPFLIEYPYGCTEQTLNRFLPAVTTRRFLESMGMSLSDAGNAAGTEGDPRSREWLKRYGDRRHANRPSPVFDDGELDKMATLGLERLAAMQNGDGGWGWFSGSGERSWPHTTAVVVYGLLAARDNGAVPPPEVLRAGLDWLRAYQDKQVGKLGLFRSGNEKEGKAKADNLDAFIHMTLVRAGRGDAAMRDFLYRDRLGLSLSGLAMLGLALEGEKETSMLEVVLDNLDQFVDRDVSAGTAWLRLPATGWWWWYNDDVETMAWYLKLLSRTDPRGDTASGLAKYLLKNRKNGTYWRSTRDTAYAVDALAEYAAASGEAKPDMLVAVFLDGAKVMERRIGPGNLLDDNRFALAGLAVEAGDHELRLVRSGAGNLYFGGGLDVFSLEDPIAGAGGDLRVERAYYKLVREEAATDMPDASGVAAAARIEKYRRVPLPSPFESGGDGGATVNSGDLVEVELTIVTANDCEYLVFEDMKAAGLEAVELTSGYSRNALGAYVEYRDQKVTLFVRQLPRGTHRIAYRFRAETPGRFSALPAIGGGMYATDLAANSDEMKVRVEEEGAL